MKEVEKILMSFGELFLIISKNLTTESCNIKRIRWYFKTPFYSDLDQQNYIFHQGEFFL